MPRVLGDIIICTNEVKSHSFGHSFERELGF